MSYRTTGRQRPVKKMVVAAVAVMAVAGTVAACGSGSADTPASKASSAALKGPKAPSLAEAITDSKAAVSGMKNFSFAMDAVFGGQHVVYEATFADFQDPAAAFFTRMVSRPEAGGVATQDETLLRVGRKVFIQPSKDVWAKVFKDPSLNTPKLQAQYLPESTADRATLLRTELGTMMKGLIDGLSVADDPTSTEPETTGKAETFEGVEVFTYTDSTSRIRVTQQTPHRMVTFEQLGAAPTGDHVTLASFSAEGVQAHPLIKPTKAQMVPELAQVLYRAWRVKDALAKSGLG